MKTFTIILLSLLMLAKFSYGGDAIRIKISGNGYSDETLIRFMNGATSAVDKEYDSYKLFSPNKNVPSIYTQANTQNLCINTYPLLTRGLNIGLYLKTPASTTYTLSLEEFGAIASGVTIYLEDVVAKAFYNMRNGQKYAFDLKAYSITNMPRFILHIGLPVVYTLNTSATSNIVFDKPGDDLWSYILFNEAGEVVQADLELNAPVQIEIKTPGMYKLKVLSAYVSEELSLMVPYSQVVTSTANIFETTKADVNVFPNPCNRNNSIMINRAPDLSNISVFDLQGQIQNVNIQKNPTSHEVALDVSHLNQGTYIITMNQGNRVVSKKIVIE